jgi:hypothetical protein
VKAVTASRAVKTDHVVKAVIASRVVKIAQHVQAAIVLKDPMIVHVVKVVNALRVVKTDQHELAVIALRVAMKNQQHAARIHVVEKCQAMPGEQMLLHLKSVHASLQMQLLAKRRRLRKEHALNKT